MYYICETDKPNFIREFFSMVKIEENQIILPINPQKKQKELTNKEKKQRKKLAEKTKKILELTNSKKIIMSKEIEKEEIYKNILSSYSVDIMNGIWLFQILIPEILEYLVKEINKKKEEIEITITVNEPTDVIVENVKLLTKEYKIINIVTNHIEKFKRLEDQLYETEGIMITVTNNRKKSLTKSEIILNIDFPNELLNQYKIKEDAIIISIEEEIKIQKKRYEGMIINDYEIKSKKNDVWEVLEQNKYKNKYCYEAQFYKKQPFLKAREKVKQDGIMIQNLYTKNGNL